MNICKTNNTYVSLMELYLMLCIQFEFNLNDAEVEEEILATICHLLCNDQNVVFWGGGNLPLHLRLWKLCMKCVSSNDIYFCKRRLWNSFAPNFMSLNDIFVWLWMNPETSLCETYVILGWFLYKNDPILLSMLQNVNRHYKRSWWNHKYANLLLLFMLLT